MRDFDHVLMTPFSALYSLEGEPLAEDYLRYRLAFFEEACRASVASQSTSDFTWLVFLDDRCSDGFRADVDALAEGVFQPVWTHESFWTASVDAVQEVSRSPFLITTRLDNDDAIARTYLERVQRQFDRQERLFVNFPRGLQVDRAGSVFRSDQPSNAFMSLIEKRHEGRPPLTIFGSPSHPKVRRDGPLREVIDSEPAWLQVIHGGNLINGVWGYRVSPHHLADHFDIDLTYRTGVSGPRLAWETLRSVPHVVRIRIQHAGLLGRDWPVAHWDRIRGTHDKPAWAPESRSARR